MPDPSPSPSPGPSIRPAQFPRCSPSTTRLGNLIAIHRPLVNMELDGQTTALRLGPAPPPATLPRAIELSLGDDRLWLCLPKESITRLCSAWLSDEPFHTLPPALRQAMLKVTLDSLLSSVSELTDVTATLLADNSDTDLSDHAGPAQDLPQLGLWQGSHAIGTLHLEPGVVAKLSAALQTRSVPLPASPRWPELPVELNMVFGETSLTASDTLGLAPGDVILLPPGVAATSAGSAHFVTMLHGHKRLARARIEGQQVTIIEQPPEPRMTDNDNADEQPAATGLNAENLDIQLSFDLGHTSLPLAELQRIEPGYTFTLQRDDATAVRLRAGDTVIGHGELVQVNDQLGVRITALYGGGDDRHGGQDSVSSDD